MTLQKSSGAGIPYRNVGFSAYNCAQGNQPWKATGQN